MPTSQNSEAQIAKPASGGSVLDAGSALSSGVWDSMRRLPPGAQPPNAVCDVRPTADADSVLGKCAIVDHDNDKDDKDTVTHKKDGQDTVTHKKDQPDEEQKDDDKHEGNKGKEKVELEDGSTPFSKKLADMLAELKKKKADVHDKDKDKDCPVTNEVSKGEGGGKGGGRANGGIKLHLQTHLEPAEQ